MQQQGGDVAVGKEGASKLVGVTRAINGATYDVTYSHAPSHINITKMPPLIMKKSL